MSFLSRPLDFKEITLYTTSLSVVSGKLSQCCNMRLLMESLFIPFREYDLTLYPEEAERLKEYWGGTIKFLPAFAVDGEIIGGLDKLQDLVDEGYLLPLVTK
ncbi:hypothetical protein GEMRC1_001678 [Eukaryota sp. GEM-RC1]